MALALTYLQSATSGSDGTSFTFASHNFGTASADRYIICGVAFRATGSVTFSSATIGGISATVVAASYNTTGGNTSASAFIIAAVPTGTSGSVVVNLSGTALRCGIGTWAATGILSATPTDSGTSTAANPTYAIDVTAGGFALGCVYNANTSTATWAGITEKYDEAVEGAGSHHTGASDIFPTTQTNLSCTATLSASSTPSGSFASWAPAPTANPKVFFFQ